MMINPRKFEMLTVLIYILKDNILHITNLSVCQTLIHTFKVKQQQWSVPILKYQVIHQIFLLLE